MAPRAGFEPATKRLTAACSTTELPGITSHAGQMHRVGGRRIANCAAACQALCRKTFPQSGRAAAIGAFSRTSANAPHGRHDRPFRLAAGRRGPRQAMSRHPPVLSDGRSPMKGESRNAVGEDPNRAPESAAAPATVSGEPSCMNHWAIGSGKGRARRRPASQETSRIIRAPRGPARNVTRRRVDGRRPECSR